MNNLSYMGLTLAGEDLLLEAQAKSARGLIAYWLKAFEYAVIKDQKLSPELKDQILYLWCNEAGELTSLPSKFRYQLKKSPYSHYDLEKAISNLENFVAWIALVLPVNSLFLSYF
jgi:hypothetical protein